MEICTAAYLAVNDVVCSVEGCVGMKWQLTNE
jgi:hypothetical protein